MTTVPAANTTDTLTPDQAAALDRAGTWIAPTWPLDRLIAVNPWWGLRDRPFSDVSARLTYLGRVHALMPPRYYRQAWDTGRITGTDLRQALNDAGLTIDNDSCVRALDAPEPDHWLNVSDWVDDDTDRHGKMAWRDEITHQLSQCLADFFQRRADDRAPDALYRAWRESLVNDAGLAIQMGEPGLMTVVRELPTSSQALIARALTDLYVPDDAIDTYAHALLLDINGWASWVAYERWQGNLSGEPCDRMRELIAARLAWEWILWRHGQQRYPERFAIVEHHWRHQVQQWANRLARHAEQQRLLWVWQRALEHAYQRPIFNALANTPATPQTRPAKLQAVFCIDVRSEVMRRALEAQDPAIQTLGFAGFFGLPLAYQPAGTDYRRPQLPGLLAPTVRARRAGKNREAKHRHRQARWDHWQRGTPATFAFVEASGLAYAAKLLKNSLRPSHSRPAVDPGAESGDWILEDDQGPLDAARQAELAAGVLNAMGLTGRLAERVLLVGHGSHSANNPHAAGLDCGACGGQSGEVNVRILAQMLNDPAVRRALTDHDIRIPDSTRFVAAVHNTMSDDIEVFETGVLPEEMTGWLAQARRQAQRERAPALGLGNLDTQKLNKALRHRSRDWSQTRPEWGLAGNAAFLIAPRERSRSLNLGGRVFLHDYDANADVEGRLLETLLTAPMVVTNWINLQYYASVTDPLKYGSGNKVLHNVVGGNIGVFEGNGGDLRIGLPLQSVHNGETWQHTPLRLTVIVAAPAERIEMLVDRHDVVRDLVENEWLYLMRWDEDGRVHRYVRQRWIEAS